MLKKSNSSSPGPDGISYAIIKKLPCLHHILATLYNKVLVSAATPSTWTSSKITLIYKKGHDSDPQNFRMIALSCTMGKIYHQIMGNRTVDYMTANKFIDPSIQKAFIQKINGTIEHNILLHEIINHAKANHKTVHISFFDLEDAFGSVSHELIEYSLKRYNFPPNVTSYVSNLYSKLHGVVKTKSWQSDPFTFKKGIFQGDPWSPIIFLTVFNPILERLTKESGFGYNLNGKQIITTPFADDFNLITTHKTSHQRIINNISSWTKSMNLKLKPPKCVSLSICSGKPTPVVFKIDNVPLATLDQSAHKFLGSTVTFSGKQSDTYKVIHDHLTTRLNRIDNLAIRDEYKTKIYKNYLLPACRFTLTVHELSKTNLTKLDSLTHKYIKKWSGLPRCATTAVIHLDNFLAIKSITELYHECHTNAFVSTRQKGDSLVNQALDTKIQRESQWTHKGSTVMISQDFNDQAVNICDNSDINNIKVKAKAIVHEHYQSLHWEHISSLAVQGEFCRISEIMDADINWKADIHGLPRGVAKFLLNSVLKSLPTKDNLRRWGKVISQSCDLCGNPETIAHVLSGCKTMLDQGRYTWRHDSVLNKIVEFVNNTEAKHILVNSDLGDKPWTIPPDILATSDRPDLVVLDLTNKCVSILELTVPYESNINSSHQYKCHKYAHLCVDLQNLGFSVKYFAFEIGCRAFISESNSKRLYAFLKSITGLKFNSRDFRSFKSSLCKTAITSSFVIFKARFCKSWITPQSFCKV